MKTQQDVLEAVKNGKKSECLDGRDFVRLSAFFDASALPTLGLVLKEGADWPEPKAWTEENIKEQLKHDVEFGFEKALDKRGLSAGSMYEVVKMWMWILDDPLQYNEDYAQYGLPLFKAVAVKYGFENPIGEEAGNEDKYSTYGGE